MKVTVVQIPKRINKMFKKVKKNGLQKEDCYSFVGECMEYGDTLHTEGELIHAMNDVLEEALKALKDNPEAVAKLNQHFSK